MMTGPTVILTVKELPLVGPQLTDAGDGAEKLQDVKPPKFGAPTMGPVRLAFIVTFRPCQRCSSR